MKTELISRDQAFYYSDKLADIVNEFIEVSETHCESPTEKALSFRQTYLKAIKLAKEINRDGNG